MTIKLSLFIAITFLSLSVESVSILEEVNSLFKYIGDIIQNIYGIPIGIPRFVSKTLKFWYEELSDTKIRNGSEYDFIVIGAGSAGSVIASRLSEIPTVSVLLVEAGSQETQLYDIPLFAVFLQALPVSWRDSTEPSKQYCRAFKDNSCKWGHGKVMGGSSTLNFQVATRGHPLEYDKWVTMGNEGWGFNDILKYFMNIENYTGYSPLQNLDIRGKNGPISVTNSAYQGSTGEAFINAGKEMGYENLDYNGYEQISFSRIQTTTKNGERWSANRGYLHIARHRSNLVLSRNSFVEKILIDPDTKTAYGVQFTKGFFSSHRYIAKAKKEVILCAGGINSPQILLLSGVGPKDHLKEMDIKVLHDSPGVGENLQDHIGVNGITFIVNVTDTIVTPNWVRPWDNTISDYINHRTGQLSYNSIQALAFVNVADPSARTGIPDIELLPTDVSIFNDPVAYKIYGMKEELMAEYRDYYLKNTVTIFPILMEPESKGTIKLRSKDPTVRPKLVPNYLSSENDIKTMLKGVRMTLKLEETEAYKKIGARRITKPVLGCEDYKYDSDDYWICHMRYFTFTFWHFAGGCKMGPANDSMAVVDPRLKVRNNNIIF